MWEELSLEQSNHVGVVQEHTNRQIKNCSKMLYIYNI